MKVKYNVLVEVGYEPVDDFPIYKVVKEFKGRKNEQNAIAYIHDQRNLRTHGYMVLEMKDENGKAYMLDDQSGKWSAVK